jgi:hypothetical protein
MLVMYLRVIGIDVGYVFLGYRYRYESCMCIIGIDVGYVFEPTNT